MRKYTIIKHTADFIAAAVVLVVLSWLLLLCALVVKFDDLKAPVMFNATRIGKDLKPFKMYKFRTMKPMFEGVGRVSQETLSRPGRFLRRTSLDELPQLLNILKGDMSIIGPRPLTVRYVPWYTKQQNLRHAVRPGITGLAQVKGRVNLAWDKRFEQDVDYVENLSLKYDLRILFMTIGQIVAGDDVLISEDDHNSYDYFDEFQRDQITKKLVSGSEILSALSDPQESVRHTGVTGGFNA